MSKATMVAIGTYFALLQWHARVSNFTVDILTEQMVTDDYGKPKARWEKVTYGVRLARSYRFCSWS